MSTTITAIRESLESTIEGLTTGGKAFGRDKYVKAPPGHDWEDPDRKWIDRTFSVGYIEEGPAEVFGLITDTLYPGEVEITIGHVKTHRKQDGLDRMNTDCMQIREQLEKAGNAPSDVALIRYEGSSRSDLDGYWVSVLSFRTLHKRALP